MKRILLFVQIIFVFSCGNKNESIKVEYKPLIEAVYASGYIHPKNEYTVFALADGYLLEKFANAGDDVKQSQILFRLDGLQQMQKVISSKQTYDVAISNFIENSPLLNELKNSLNSAKLKKENDSLNYCRVKNLFEKDVSTQFDFDKAKLSFKISSNEFQSSLDRYNRTLQQVKVDLQNAKSQYKINQKDSENYTIKSILNGTLFEIYKERGELVRRGEPIAIIGEKDNMYIQLLVDEQDIHKIKTGQKIEIKIDAFDGTIFTAFVTKIYPMERKHDQSFRIDAEFANNEKKVMAGMGIEANIIISQKEKAMVIPKNYLLKGDSICIIQDGQINKIKVEKGISNFDFVEILSGIDDKTELVKNEP